MNPEFRKNVGRYLSEVKPANEPWFEKRMAVNWDGNIYLINNNFPHWTATQILDFFKSQGLEPFDLEVTVTPTIPNHRIVNVDDFSQQSGNSPD